MVLFSPLPQTNLQFNNNKYYLIQLLEDDAQRNFSVWMRWGRGKGFVMAYVSSHSETSAEGEALWGWEDSVHWADGPAYRLWHLASRVDRICCLAFAPFPSPFPACCYTISRETSGRCLVPARAVLGVTGTEPSVYGVSFAVGKTGQHSLVTCSGDLNKAKEIFQKK